MSGVVLRRLRSLGAAATAATQESGPCTSMRTSLMVLHKISINKRRQTGKEVTGSVRRAAGWSTAGIRTSANGTLKSTRTSTRCPETSTESIPSLVNDENSRARFAPARAADAIIPWLQIVRNLRGVPRCRVSSAGYATRQAVARESSTHTGMSVPFKYGPRILVGMNGAWRSTDDGKVAADPSVLRMRLKKIVCIDYINLAQEAYHYRRTHRQTCRNLCAVWSPSRIEPRCCRHPQHQP